MLEEEQQAAARIHVVEDWFEELTRLIAVTKPTDRWSSRPVGFEIRDRNDTSSPLYPERPPEAALLPAEAGRVPRLAMTVDHLLRRTI
jgi:hypothetical protein